MEQRNDNRVDSCISHLQDHADHYLRLIRSKPSDGVLWAAFTVSGATPGISLTKAAFLPLSTMSSAKAEVLRNMLASCDHSRQFVCWFTLTEDRVVGSPETLASKVLIIDCGGSINDDAVSLALTAAPAEAPPSHPHVQPNPSLFASLTPRDAHRSAQMIEQPQQRANGSIAAVAPRSTSPKSVRELLAAVAAKGGKKITSPSSAPAGEVIASPRIGGVPPASAAAPPPRDEVHTLMKLVMQVADSVAAMGTSLDNLTNRCSMIESSTDGLRSRIRELETIVCGPEYDYEAEHVGVNDAAAAAVSKKSRHRSLLTSSELAIQMTDLSLRVSETENRVRGLEAHAQAADVARRQLFEHVEALKGRVHDIAVNHDIPIVVAPASASGRAGMGIGGYAAEYMPNAAPNTTAANISSGTGGSSSLHASQQQPPAWTQSIPIVGSPREVLSESPPRNNSPWRVAMRQQQAYDESTAVPGAPPSSTSASVSGGIKKLAQDAPQSAVRPGALTDMIRDLELRLGGGKKGP